MKSMKRLLSKFIILVLILTTVNTVPVSSAVSGSSDSEIKAIKITYEFPNLGTTKVNMNNQEFDNIHINDCYGGGDAGKPELPAKGVMINLPYGVNPNIVINIKDERAYTNIYPNPGQPPTPTCTLPPYPVDNFKMDMDIYNSNNYYPDNIANISTGFMRNMRFAMINVTPVQVNLMSKTLNYYKKIELLVILEPTDDPSTYGEPGLNDPFYNQVFSLSTKNIAPSPNNVGITYEYVTYTAPTQTTVPEPTLTPSPEPTLEPTSPIPYDCSLEPDQLNVLKTGDIGQVKLVENYSTGNQWYYEIEDTSIISLDYDKHVPNPIVIPGAPGTHFWNFKSLKEGETKIVFTYKPYWSTSSENITQALVYNIKVSSSDNITVSPTPIPTSFTPTPSASFAPTPTLNNPFTDLNNVEWAREAIITFANAGVINGYGDGTFRPDNDITRAEFIKFLCYAFHFTAFIDYSGLRFHDVPLNAWYIDCLAIADYYGLVQGDGNGNFRPDATITREEMFIFCARALQKLNKVELLAKDSPEIVSQLNKFVDGNSVSDWAKEYVATVIQLGLVTGSPVENEYSINPQNPITRAEVAVILDRAIKLSANPTPT